MRRARRNANERWIFASRNARCNDGDSPLEVLFISSAIEGGLALGTRAPNRVACTGRCIAASPDVECSRDAAVRAIADGACNYIREQAELHRKFLNALLLSQYNRRARLKSAICEATEEVVRLINQAQEIRAFRVWLIDQVSQGIAFADISIYEVESYSNPTRWVESWEEFEDCGEVTREMLCSDLLSAYAAVCQEAQRNGWYSEDAGWELLRRVYKGNRCCSSRRRRTFDPPNRTPYSGNGPGCCLRYGKAARTLRRSAIWPLCIS